MTSTHSASDWLNSFAPCFCFPRSLLIPSDTCLLISLNRIFALSNDSLLVTSYLPVENVLRDLEPMIAAQHYRNLVLLGPNLISLCWSPPFCKIFSRFRRSASACISIACLVEAAEMISRISYWMLQALAVPLTILTTA